MQILRQWINRFRGWMMRRGVERHPRPDFKFVVPLGGAILRDVSPAGVRVYSLCGSCGARLEVSATLCGACAARRSPSSF
jgi:hypothetical protein